MASGSFLEVRQRHRFKDISNSQEESLLSAAVAPKTRVATDFWVKIFNSFLVEKKITLDTKICTVEELNDSLKAIYFGISKKTGGLYQAGRYISACSAIQRHLISPKRTLSIHDSEEFMTSNWLDVVGCGFEENKAEGSSKPVLHKESISEADKMQNSVVWCDLTVSCSQIFIAPSGRRTTGLHGWLIGVTL